MTLGMAAFTNSACIVSVGNPSLIRHRHLKVSKSQKLLKRDDFKRTSTRDLAVACTNLSRWEPAPIAYAPPDDDDDTRVESTERSFETMVKSVDEDKDVETVSTTKPVIKRNYFKWLVWVLGPALLLATGMVPTLWLPLTSVFLGPNIASLLSLTGLDCIFNLGAFLFLLLAHSCSRDPTTTNSPRPYNKPPASYRFWNMFSNITGFIIPLLTLLGSYKALLQPSLPSIGFSVLLGPYLLLLSVQILTEILTWHWQSPVWLVTPVVYEAYRLLQLMRGLKLGLELAAPSWMLNTIRGLVCWWVLVLGMQLMRVAWYAGFTARADQPESPKKLVV